ncbi:NUDIX hydrolase [Poritiphilus flavus]|uniref:NUDIX domain-containing protein n=1 Tax=Poritiphilus flavus TaxID=2697053 RepID=A0A6L9E9P4_9FLAO|nr:NUDIX domain-containing protein [Poritiphilus flavus]NAS11507.1 NUDIX domain-containing protein [Poritiphilus flavus]
MSEIHADILASIREDIPKFIPQLSVNCMIFRFCDQKLQVSVVQPINSDFWVLPGGFVYQDESIDEAARRTILEQTEVADLILSQFGTYGQADRNFKEEFSAFAESVFAPDIYEWLSNRFVTIGYYSILGDLTIKLRKNPLFEKVEWMNIDDIGQLALDHTELVMEARKVMARELLSKPLLLSFIPDTFTIPELQKLYEEILGRSVDRGNFRQKMLKSNSLIKIGPSKAKTKSRPPDLYKLDRKNYLRSLSENFKFGF